MTHKITQLGHNVRMRGAEEAGVSGSSSWLNDYFRVGHGHEPRLLFTEKNVLPLGRHQLESQDPFWESQGRDASLLLLTLS